MLTIKATIQTIQTIQTVQQAIANNAIKRERALVDEKDM